MRKMRKTDLFNSNLENVVETLNDILKPGI